MLQLAAMWVQWAESVRLRVVVMAMGWTSLACLHRVLCALMATVRLVAPHRMVSMMCLRAALECLWEGKVAVVAAARVQCSRAHPRRRSVCQEVLLAARGWVV